LAQDASNDVSHDPTAITQKSVGLAIFKLFFQIFEIIFKISKLEKKTACVPYTYFVSVYLIQFSDLKSAGSLPSYEDFEFTWSLSDYILCPTLGMGFAHISL